MDIQTCYDKLNGYTNQKLTTKQLTEMGITRYFIDKFLKSGKLERVKRGEYLVKSLSKGLKSRRNFYFREMCECISRGDYEKAYMNLQKAYDSKADDKSDNLFRVSFILLSEIIDYRNPVTYLNALKELTLENKIGALNWNNFCSSVVKKDYPSALKHIQAFAAYHKEKDGKVGDVTIAMINLLEKVISLNADRQFFANFIDHIDTLIDEGKYEEALDYANLNKDMIKDTQIKAKIQPLLELITTNLTLRRGENVTIESSYMGNYGRNHPKVLLALYLRDKNYLKALEYIEDACKVDGRNYNLLVRKLLLEFKQFNVNTKSNAKKIISIPYSRHHFNNFLKMYSIKNIDASLQELDLSINYLPTDDENYQHNLKLSRLIKKYIKMRDEGEVFEDVNIQYNLKDNAVNNFNKAIDYRDYKKASAFKNVIKGINSEVFHIKVEILQEMSKLDKINREKQVKEEINENKDSIVEERQEIKENKVTIPKRVNNLPFSYDDLYDSVYNRNYDYAYDLVNSESEKGNYGRLCSVSSRLIKAYKELSSGIYNEPQECELMDDLIKDFYRAINNYDYALALDLVSEIIDVKSGTEEFKIYKMILEDIVDLYNKNMRAKEIREEIGNIANKYLTVDDVYSLIDLIQELRELEKDIPSLKNNYNIIADIAEMTLYGINEGFTDMDFVPTNLDGQATLEEKFTEALNMGDYPTVKRIISTGSWDLEIMKKYSKNFLKLVKKLTSLMLKNMRSTVPSLKEVREAENTEVTEAMEEEINRLAYEIMTEEERRDKKTANGLEQMRYLIKKRHYEDAYQLYISTDIDYKDLEVIGNLLFIRAHLAMEAEDLYNKYLRGLEENNPDTTKYLNDYKDYIERNFMENTQSYKEKNLKP